MHTIYLCRHGDTAWSPVRRLAGRSDIALTEFGEQNARQIGQRLRGIAFDRVWVSPLVRARRTAELAGFADRAVVDDRLVEMSFGDYEGQLTADVRRDRPDWVYLRDGCPNGETPADLGRRADAFLAEHRGLTGTSLIFAHSVILRVLTARFLGLPPEAARNLTMWPAALSVLGFDVVDDAPTILHWNDHAHTRKPDL
ncbi:MAG TPA: histidine phosphatase family protein [Kofleriaceae bacterium]|nr:histidine phosphatase family protein [Kofleriaceae bacterium]